MATMRTSPYTQGMSFRTGGAAGRRSSYLAVAFVVVLVAFGAARFRVDSLFLGFWGFLGAIGIQTVSKWGARSKSVARFLTIEWAPAHGRQKHRRGALQVGFPPRPRDADPAARRLRPRRGGAPRGLRGRGGAVAL